MIKDGDSFEEMLVLAESDSGVPLTADYDLFAVLPSLNKFSGERTTGFRSVANIVSKALAQKERRIVYPNSGRISNLTRTVKREINANIGLKKSDPSWLRARQSGYRARLSNHCFYTLG